MTRPGHVRSELFGVTLHGDDQAIVRLHPFDRAVLAGGGLLEPVRQVLDRLMVQAVDPDLVLTGRPAQLGRRIYVDRVREVAAAQRAHLVTLEMLNQRASHGDVDDLLAATDAEHREPTLSRLVKKRQLGLIELRVGLSEILVPPLSVKGRIDVPAAWEEQPAELRKHEQDGNEGDPDHRDPSDHVAPPSEVPWTALEPLACQ